MAETVYLLLGSNIGDRERYLQVARELLGRIEGLEIITASSIYLTEPAEMHGDFPNFMNQVIKAEYGHTAHELLHQLERVEYLLGREGKGQMLPRTIDCDILLFGEQVIDTEHLVIPHPRLLRRAFAMVPLLEIDPDLIHPGTLQPIASYLRPADRHKVVLYKEHVA